jgi:hypothetical protein
MRRSERFTEDSFVVVIDDGMISSIVPAGGRRLRSLLLQDAGRRAGAISFFAALL